MMEYRIEHRGRERFLALQKTFSEGKKKDENGGTIPEFWTECHEKDLIAPMMMFSSKKGKSLYGLCASLKECKKHFNYGIGVLLDEDVDQVVLTPFLERGYSIWETEPNDFVVFRCVGQDATCLDDAWNHFFKKFSHESGYSHTGDTDFELYPEQDENGLFCELWIPIKKK